jgi:uncharacterized membrane protein YedE/YeeE
MTVRSDNLRMQEPDVRAISTMVLWSAFALSTVFGGLAQRTHFCTMGAVADIVNMGDWTRMRMWVLAIAVAIVGFNGMVGMGWIEARHSNYAGAQLRWLSLITGGLLFGFGMVLASGCGSKSLVRLGGGNLKALVVIVVLGISAFATLKGLTAVLRVRTVDAVVLQLPRGQDLPTLAAAWIGAPIPAVAAALGLVLGLGLMAWVVRQPEGRTADVWLGGVGSGAVVVAMWWVSGRLGYLPEHPETLQEVFLATNSRRMEALSMVAPVGYALDWLLYFSDASKALTTGIVSVVGVLFGSALVALGTGTFRWEGFTNVEDMGNHLVGAVLMGVGGVTAMGCTLGQGLSGISTLSMGSVLALAGIVAGGVAALRYQSWRLDRMV